MPLQTREQGARRGRGLPRRYARDMPREFWSDVVKVWKRGRGKRYACHQVPCNFARSLHKYRGYFGGAAEVRVSWIVLGVCVARPNVNQVLRFT